MEILEKPNGRKEGCASLANIGYNMFDISLDGELYKYGVLNKPIHCEEDRVGSNKWKIYTHDRAGNLIERVMHQDVLVGCAWYNIKESLWQNSTYADTIRRCKEFFSIPNRDKAPTSYQTSNGLYYYVTKFGEVWSTESMIKLKGGINSCGYRNVKLGSAHGVNVHRLVAQHFVPIPEDLSEENLVVNHLDGNKLNNRWDNLEWITQNGNMEHASINGLMHTTIDKQLLEYVWQRLQDGYSDINISRETGVPAPTVNCIRRGTSPRYRTDKYTWSKYSSKLDKATIFSIYDEFTYTDKNNSEIGRKYNVSYQLIYYLRVGRTHYDLAREYINSKGLDGYWKGFSPPK